MQSNFGMLFHDLQDAVVRQSYNKCKYVRIRDKFEHGEVKGSQVQGRGHSKKTGSMSKDQQESQGDLDNHICRVVEILVKTSPESAILLSTSLMVTRRAVFPMPILTHHLPLQD